MPKYVEEREIPPVAGAFGTTMSLQQWMRSHRADADFYEGTGSYRNALRIYVEEECGYREWVWTFFGTVEELVQEWKAGRRPIYPTVWADPLSPSYFHRGYRTAPHFHGEVHEITWRPKYCRQRPKPFLVDPDLVWMNGLGAHPYIVETGYPLLCIDGRDGFDGRAHVHEEDDTVLDISFYKLTGLHDIQVEIVAEKVLGEMAKIA